MKLPCASEESHNHKLSWLSLSDHWSGLFASSHWIDWPSRHPWMISVWKTKTFTLYNTGSQWNSCFNIAIVDSYSSLNLNLKMLFFEHMHKQSSCSHEANAHAQGSTRMHACAYMYMHMQLVCMNRARAQVHKRTCSAHAQAEHVHTRTGTKMHICTCRTHAHYAQRKATTCTSCLGLPCNILQGSEPMIHSNE